MAPAPKSARRQQLESRCSTRSTGSRSARASSAASSTSSSARSRATSTGSQTLGSATLTAFIVQAVTGVVLAMYYKPHPDKAYESIRYITNDVTLGWLVRGMHRWGASVFIILMFFHMARVFLFGAYKYPRELNWIVGVLLLAARACSRASPATCCRGTRPRTGRRSSGSTSTATAPFVGPFLAQFLQGGAEIGADTLARFYSLHMLAAPGRDHRADRPPPLPRRPARRHLAAVVERGGRPRARRGARAATAARGPRPAGRARSEPAK